MKMLVGFLHMFVVFEAFLGGDGTVGVSNRRCFQDPYMLKPGSSQASMLL